MHIYVYIDVSSQRGRAIRVRTSVRRQRPSASAYFSAVVRERCLYTILWHAIYTTLSILYYTILYYTILYYTTLYVTPGASSGTDFEPRPAEALQPHKRNRSPHDTLGF